MLNRKITLLKNKIKLKEEYLQKQKKEKRSRCKEQTILKRLRLIRHNRCKQKHIELNYFYSSIPNELKLSHTNIQINISTLNNSEIKQLCTHIKTSKTLHTLTIYGNSTFKQKQHIVLQVVQSIQKSNSIKSLTLSYLYFIPTILSIVWTLFQKVDCLFLKHNDISHVDCNLLKNSHVLSLDLRYNKLTNVNELVKTVIENKRIQYLDLKHNEIEKIDYNLQKEYQKRNYLCFDLWD
jgi:Leucine-rich repeat (LRR) protein